jgi:hypothetical protein
VTLAAHPGAGGAKAVFVDADAHQPIDVDDPHRAVADRTGGEWNRAR